MDGEAATPHVLVFPFPAQGVVTPMLTFSQLLAGRGVVVTFLNTDTTHALLQLGADGKDVAAAADSDTQGSQQIRFAVIPHGSQAPLPGFQHSPEPNNAFVELQNGLEKQQGVIEEMVVRSRATSHPITCIIAHAAFEWISPLASKLGIQRVVFWTANAAGWATGVELNSGKLKVPGLDTDEPTAGVPISQSEWLSTLFRTPERLETFIGTFKSLEGTTCILVNTFEELEGSSLKACAPGGVKVLPIGPIVPLGAGKRVSSISFYREESGCIDWLDKQAPRSVLYVSFGSVATLTAQEIEELAVGIEGSKQPFLWVLRDDSHGALLEGFLDRTRDRGLVVKWAPQIRVLGHGAVGGFLTHCGWNSVLEGISTGVPMLCYPMILDQMVNALLMARIWKLGIGISKKGEDVITREDIKHGILKLFSFEDVRASVSRWKALAERTLQPGGSSYVALDHFIDLLRG